MYALGERPRSGHFAILNLFLLRIKFPVSAPLKVPSTWGPSYKTTFRHFPWSGCGGKTSPARSHFVTKRPRRAIRQNLVFLSGSAGRSGGTDNSRHSQSSDWSVTTRAVLNSSDCELGAFDSLTRTKLMAINTEGKEMSMSTLLLDVMWSDMFSAT
jgi:hypothetical protein